MDLNLFPWDYEDKKPYWVNPDNDLEWWIDESTTKYCYEEKPLNPLPPLKTVVFYVCERKNDKVSPISRVMVDRETNQEIAHETSLEALAYKIDMMRLAIS